MSGFRTLTLADCLAVVGAMRDRDRECVRALRGPISDDDFAMDRVQAYGPAWSLQQDGRAVAVGGISFQNSWACTFWMFATDEMTRESWRKLIRHTRTVLGNATNPAHEHYRHRVEAYTLDGWQGAADLAARFGFVHEGVRKGFGSGGEDMNVWAIVGPVKGAR
jgi:hypothetical protein